MYTRMHPHAMHRHTRTWEYSKLDFSVFYNLFKPKNVGFAMKESKEAPARFVIYTDGASTIKNVKMGDVAQRMFYGGWAFVVIDCADGTVLATGSGGGRFKTGQAELCAIGAAYDWLEKTGNRGCKIKFKSDSQYAIKAMIDLIFRPEPWKLATANQHILRRLKHVVNRHGGASLARYYHVKGHDGNIHNETADELAVAAKIQFMATQHPQDLDALEIGLKSIVIPKSSPKPTVYYLKYSENKQLDQSKTPKRQC